MTESESAISVMSEKCSKFSEDMTKRYVGELSEQELFLWQSTFINSKYYEAARIITEYNPDCTDSEMNNLEKLIVKAESAETTYKPTRCITHGCSEEQVAKCHVRVVKNENGEITNSPAYFIREEFLNEYIEKLKFDELKEEIFSRIANGDRSAHMDEEFIKLVSTMRKKNFTGFSKLKEELTNLKVKMTDFNSQIDKISKSVNVAKDVKGDITVPDALKSYADILDGGDVFINSEGYLQMVCTSLNGPYIETLSNFVAWIKTVYKFDDGVDIKIQFEITGLKDGIQELPLITVDAYEFRPMRWVLDRWGNVIITSAPKATDIVRTTIQVISVNVPEITIHYMIGWKEIEGNWFYLYSNGLIGDSNNLVVSEIHELKGYYFAEPKYGVEECSLYLDKFISVATHEISIPLLAYAFLSILIEKFKQEGITIKFLIWAYGATGSFKTALCMVLMSFFGNFESPPATFNDTAVALEKKGYLAKDSLLLVDDFHPATTPSEAKTKASIANGLTRRYGDRITRSRSKSNLQLAKDYPPRGNLICTSEDLLVGTSTNSRHMGVPIHRGDIDDKTLTELQNNKDKLNCFMYYFIGYIAENVMNNPNASYKDKFLVYRDKSQDSNNHKRFAEAIACLQIGWEELLNFLKSVGHIDDAKYREYAEEGYQIFCNLAKKQNDLVQNDDIADKYMMALKELIDTREVIPKKKDVPSLLSRDTTICYEDIDFYYFIPQSTFAKVTEFYAKKGDLLNINETMLRKMLVDRKYLAVPPDNDRHLTVQIKVGLSTIRVLKIPKSILNTF